MTETFCKILKKFLNFLNLDPESSSFLANGLKGVYFLFLIWGAFLIFSLYYRKKVQSLRGVYTESKLLPKIKFNLLNIVHKICSNVFLYT